MRAIELVDRRRSGRRRSRRRGRPGGSLRSMIWRAARSGIAPSSALATSMRMRRSFLATTISRPSPTSRRPIFQAVGHALRVGRRCPRAPWSAPSARRSAGRAAASKAASLASSARAAPASSVPVWSMTRRRQRAAPAARPAPTPRRPAQASSAQQPAAAASKQHGAHRPRCRRRLTSEPRGAGLSKFTAGGARSAPRSAP